MPRLSKLIEKLENWLEPYVGPWYERHKKRLPLYIAGGLVGWYLYGMFLNSIKLGTVATFHKSGEEVVESIWVFNPFRSWFVLFTPFGLGVTAVIVLLICLVTRKGFNWLSGNKLTYVVNLKDANGKLLPIEKRGLGDVYQLLAHQSIQEINRTLAQLPPDHPAKGHHGLFLKAKENLWGSIAIGLGNRLAIFQNKLVDAITRNHDVDLLLPGQKPCAYFVIISAQDSAYRFLSSLFFSLALPRLSDYARLKGKTAACRCW